MERIEMKIPDLCVQVAPARVMSTQNDPRPTVMDLRNQSSSGSGERTVRRIATIMMAMVSVAANMTVGVEE